MDSFSSNKLSQEIVRLFFVSNKIGKTIEDVNLKYNNFIDDLISSNISVEEIDVRIRFSIIFGEAGKVIEKLFIANSELLVILTNNFQNSELYLDSLSAYKTECPFNKCLLLSFEKKRRIKNFSI